jgi:alkylhydroperoxidase family enzyme
MSRLPMLTRDDIAAEDHDVFGAGMNLHRQTLHSPQLARHSRRLGLYFRRESRLPGRICELAILRVARLARSAYEYSHHLKIALEVGASEADLLRLARGEPFDDDPLAEAALAAATAIFHGGAGEDTVERLKALLAPDQVVDLLFVASFYAGFVRFTASLALEVEPEFAPFLERFPLPT